MLFEQGLNYLESTAVPVIYPDILSYEKPSSLLLKKLLFVAKTDVGFGTLINLPPIKT